VACLGPGLAVADEPGEPAPPPVPLDRLFELPSGFEPHKAEERRGVGETEWRKRFREARQRLATAEDTLAASKLELADLAESSEAWKVAPPVGMPTGANTDAPLSYELRQRMKREEAEVNDARRDLLDLEVQANLAGVPEAWRTE
jgi:hypothetical protein